MNPGGFAKTFGGGGGVQQGEIRLRFYSLLLRAHPPEVSHVHVFMWPPQSLAGRQEIKRKRATHLRELEQFTEDLSAFPFDRVRPGGFSRQAPNAHQQIRHGQLFRIINISTAAEAGGAEGRYYEWMTFGIDKRRVTWKRSVYNVLPLAFLLKTMEKMAQTLAAMEDAAIAAKTAAFKDIRKSSKGIRKSQAKCFLFTLIDAWLVSVGASAVSSMAGGTGVLQLIRSDQSPVNWWRFMDGMMAVAWILSGLLVITLDL